MLASGFRAFFAKGKSTLVRCALQKTGNPAGEQPGYVAILRAKSPSKIEKFVLYFAGGFLSKTGVSESHVARMLASGFPGFIAEGKPA
jgi:hypothetical protein